MTKKQLIEKIQYCMKSPADYTEFVEYEYVFLAHYFSVIKPKNILIFGGFTNIDVFIAASCVDSKDMKITNVDFSGNPQFMEQKHNQYKDFFGYEGTYTFLNQYVDLDNFNLNDYDLVWDNIKCVQSADLSNLQTVILTHYQSPKSYIWKDSINQQIPLSVELRSSSIFANIDTKFIYNFRNFFDFPCEKTLLNYKDQLILALDHQIKHKIQWQKERELNLMNNNEVIDFYDRPAIADQFNTYEWVDKWRK